MNTRVCSRCKTGLPLTGEFFARSKQDKKGFKYWCKKCNREAGKVWREKNLPAQTVRIRLEKKTGLRVCKTCGESKPLAESFPKIKCPKGERYWKRECKACRQLKRNGGRASKRRSSRTQVLVTRGTETYKYCDKCDTEKPVLSFSRTKQTTTGYRGPCKQCRNSQYAEEQRRKGIPKRVPMTEEERALRKREYYAKQPKKTKAEWKVYYAANKDRLRATQQKWKAENLDKARGYGRKWYRENTVQVKAYKEANKDKIREAQRAWGQKNKEALRERNKNCPSYAAVLLGGGVNSMPSELLEAKLLQVQIQRLAKQK